MCSGKASGVTSVWIIFDQLEIEARLQEAEHQQSITLPRFA
jgi:hypothetical protein